MVTFVVVLPNIGSLEQKGVCLEFSSNPAKETLTQKHTCELVDEITYRLEMPV